MLSLTMISRMMPRIVSVMCKSAPPSKAVEDGSKNDGARRICIRLTLYIAWEK